MPMTMGRQRDFPDEPAKDNAKCDAGMSESDDPAETNPVDVIMSTPVEPEIPSTAPVGMMIGLVLGCALWAAIAALAIVAWILIDG